MSCVASGLHVHEHFDEPTGVGVYGVKMAPRRRGKVVRGEAETSSDDEPPKQDAVAAAMAAVMAPAPEPEPEPEEAPAETAEEGDAGAAAEPEAVPEVVSAASEDQTKRKGKKAGKKPKYGEAATGESASPEADPAETKTTEKKKRRPTVRTVEVTAPAAAPVAAPAAEPEPTAQAPEASPTAPSSTENAAAAPAVAAPAKAATQPQAAALVEVEEEDEFGDRVVRKRAAPVAAEAGEALVRVDASEPDMLGSPDTHRRNLLAFGGEEEAEAAAADSHEASAGATAASPEAAAPEETIIDRLKRRLRSATVSASQPKPADRGSSKHVDPEDDAPPSDRPPQPDAGRSAADEALETALRRLKRASTRNAAEVLAHYRPSTYPDRCEQHRIGVGVKLRHEVVPPPELPDMSTPPTSLSAPYRQADSEAALRRAQRGPPAPAALALQDVKRVLVFEALRDAQSTIQRHNSAAERRGHIVMQARANANATSATIQAICDTGDAMRTAICPFFSATSQLEAQ